MIIPSELFSGKKHGLLILLFCLFGFQAAPVLLADNDSPIIFEDGFESGDLEKWDADSVVNDPTRLKLTNDPEEVYKGEYAVEITAVTGTQTGAKLNKWFMPGYDQVYARWYCKFESDFNQGNHMHFVHLLANRQANKWSAFGKAGIKPSGDDFFTTGLEPWRNWGRNSPPGEMMFYSYHMDMPIDSQTNLYYGEMFRPEEKFIPQRGRWYCMEMMVKANTPGEADGQQAFWIDGDLKGQFTNIRWRSSESLKINDFWLLLYIHDSPKLNRVWFDEVVVSREYIGPIKNQSNADHKKYR